MDNNKSNASKEELAIQNILDTYKLINMEDAREETEVTIPAYENMREGDTIDVFWGDEWNIEKGEKKKNKE
ncbi:hypothetical protein [Bacillus rhizoplanae]|uniref:hypothetical protein n=1 Tax=Bacillus rhizoplanae TaxID=2880966 RepID=UPI003D24CDEB